MKTSKRNPVLSREWFRQRIHRLRQDLEFADTLKEITGLQNGVWQGQDCSHELTVFACLAVSPHQGRPAILEREWASKTGKSWKVLKEFPRRLDGMAKEVEGINAGDRLFFARRRNNDLNRDELRKLAQNCRQLPDMIRSYAAALRERNAAVAKATPHDGRFEALHNLSEHVKLFTGAYHDKEVERLLRAAALALGEGDSFEAVTIAQVRYRRRKRGARS